MPQCLPLNPSNFGELRSVLQLACTFHWEMTNWEVTETARNCRCFPCFSFNFFLFDHCARVDVLSMAICCTPRWMPEESTRSTRSARKKSQESWQNCRNLSWQLWILIVPWSCENQGRFGQIRPSAQLMKWYLWWAVGLYNQDVSSEQAHLDWGTIEYDQYFHQYFHQYFPSILSSTFINIYQPLSYTSPSPAMTADVDIGWGFSLGAEEISPGDAWSDAPSFCVERKRCWDKKTTQTRYMSYT